MNTEQKELWDSYDGKGFAAQYSQYSERARTDADEHDITLTISNDTVTLIGGKDITAASATSATRATQDASGNVITDTYATKSELSDYCDITYTAGTGELHLDFSGGNT